jgi:hypothetical protein
MQALDLKSWVEPKLPDKGTRTLEALASYAMVLADAVWKVYRDNSARPETFPRSVDDFVAIIKKIYTQRDFRIRQIPANYTDGIVAGLSVRTSKSSQVDSYITDPQDTSLTRYVVCREMFLLLPQHDGLKTGEVSDTLRDEIYQSLLGSEGQRPLPSSEIEFVADVAAVQFLFPIEERLLASVQIASGTSPAMIAAQYRIPADVTQLYTLPRMVSYFQNLWLRGAEG